MEQATKIFNRMTELEKMDVRRATESRLSYLGDTNFRVDLPAHSFADRAAVMKEVQALCALEFSNKSQNTTFSGITWKF